MPNSTVLSRAGQQFMILLANQKFLLFVTRVGEYIAPRLKICSTCVGLNDAYQRSNQATRPACACLSVTGTGHSFEAWPVPGRPGQGSRKARQAAQNRQAMACLRYFLTVNRNIIFDQET
jgi:hypothetical protein